MLTDNTLRAAVEKAMDDPERRCPHLAPKALICADCAVSVALRLVQEEIDKMTKIRWPEGVKPAPEALRPRVEGMEAVAPADPLCEEIEKAMGALVIHQTDRCIDHVPATGAVSVCEAMVRQEQERADDNFASYERLKARAEAAEKERDENARWARDEMEKGLQIGKQLAASRGAVDDLVKALAEYREKFGHVAQCRCLRDGHDPRCAPESK